MFGLIDSDRSDEATGRVFRALGGRRFRGFGDVDYSPIIAAAIQGTVQVAGAVANAYVSNQRTQTQQQANPCAQWPGSYFDPTTGRCAGAAAQPTGGSSSFFSNIDPMTLVIGGGVLLLLFTMRKD